MKLIEELYGQGIISDEKKQALLSEIEKTEKTEEEVIIQHKIVDEDFLFKLKSRIINKPLLKPTAEEIPVEVFQRRPPPITK